MSPVFDEHDSALKKTIMILFWAFCAMVALALAKALLAGVAAMIPVVVWVGPAVWVYWNAQKRGVARPFLWALLVLLTWVIGLVVYLLAHSDDDALPLCPACGARVRRDYACCPHCGGDVSDARSRCAACGKRADPTWEFCSRCGARLRNTVERMGAPTDAAVEQ
ncbi:MAG: zinc ribbon domain-containing protein [Candidatus Eisenbacteria bacterium]|nr:zinc ribbon domain-containing protein [Candidatus Eisenbacteria bacterium]